MSSTCSHPRPIYEIQIQGALDAGWQEWFAGLSITLAYRGDRAPTTTLVGPVVDQAALRGLLCRLWDLNLTLISVRRIEADSKEEKKSG